MNSPRSSRKAATLKSSDKRGAASFAALSNALTNFEHAPDSGYVRLPVVCALFRVSSATIWRWAKSGRIPGPYKLSEGVSAWNVGELRQALDRDEQS